MRIMVAGGSKFYSSISIFDILDMLVKDGDILMFNDCPTGVSNVALGYAQERSLPYDIYNTDTEHYGGDAQYIRDMSMLKEGKPDLCIVFPGDSNVDIFTELCKELKVPFVDFRYGMDFFNRDLWGKL